MYDDLTASFLTESLKNIFYQDAKGSGNKYQSINSLQYDWEIETNYIKRVEFAAVPEGDGAGGTEIIMAFRERYYEKYDTFKIENSGQQCQVVSRPVRKGDNSPIIVPVKFFKLLEIINNQQQICDLQRCSTTRRNPQILIEKLNYYEIYYIYNQK